MADARCLHAHQRRRAHDYEQNECGQAERGDVVEAMGARAPQATAPMRLDFSRTLRPGTCAPRTGGSSRPTNSRRFLPAFSAGNMPIYDPESTVSSPERLPANSRGFTTQNTVPSVSSGSACRVVTTVTITCVWSGESSKFFTVPKTISLYLSCDCPACSRSLLRQRVPSEPGADRDGNKRHDPNDRKATRTARRGLRHHPLLGEISHGQSPHLGPVAARRRKPESVFKKRSLHKSPLKPDNTWKRAVAIMG